MKRLAIIVVLLTSTVSATFAGGARTDFHVPIDVFDQSFNFYYKSINDTIVYTNEKGKEKQAKATQNVNFYNIDKGTSFNLFDKSFNEKIVAFFFENEYVDSLKNIQFTECDNYYGSEYIKNNQNITKRPVSENIFIVTYSYQTDKHTLWSCHKTGTQLIQVTTFGSFVDFKVDVFNKNVLTISQLNREVKINKKKY